MNKYIIDYGTGVSDEVECSDIYEAQEIAEEGMTYTGQNVEIKLKEGSESGGLYCISRWYPVEPTTDEDLEVLLVQFGSFGFYAKWE